MTFPALVLALAIVAPADEEIPATEMFTALFKHVEPHAVTGIWIGGEAGLGFVDIHRTDAAGEFILDSFGHYETFHSSAELTEHYAAQMGGGRGVMIYNINTAQWVAGGLLLLLGWLAATRARRVSGGAPRGKAYHVFESFVLYVRDEMVYSNMGEHHGKRFVPLFLTMFFFILFMNWLGLVPDFTGGFLGTATANLAVTAALALTTLFWIHMSGIREHGFFHHWKNFMPPGLPIFVVPIMIPIELIGMLVKPVALALRLFANMLAGHLVVLSFIGLAFYAGTWIVAPLPLAMAIGISILEVFFGLVQAFVFTYLSIIFVGATVHPEH